MTSISDPAALGELLRAQRKRLALTLDDCAQAARISRQTLVAVESGQGNPRLRTLQALTAVLGLEMGLLASVQS